VHVTTEVIWVGGAHVQEVDARVIGQTVRARATVLRCAVTRANSGGGLRWLKPMVEAACMHVCVGPMSSSRVWGGSVVRPDEVKCNCISLFKEKLL
jgi:hypothetical protein